MRLKKILKKILNEFNNYCEEVYKIINSDCEFEGKQRAVFNMLNIALALNRAGVFVCKYIEKPLCAYNNLEMTRILHYYE